MAVAVALLALELLLRIPLLHQTTAIDPTLRVNGLVYVPNQVSPHRLGTEIQTEIRINNRGFRDVHFEGFPANGSKSVVALGDSFTEGWGVHLEESWPKLLERRLTQDGSGVTRVYNAGHNGTNPKNRIAVYRRYFKDDPSVRVVVLGYCLVNDIVEELTPEEIHNGQRTVWQDLRFTLSKHSITYNMLRHRVRSDMRVDAFLSKFGASFKPEIPMDLRRSEANTRRWPYTVNLLSSFHDELARSGRRLTVVLFPTKELVLDDHFERMLAATNAPPHTVERFGFRDYAVRRLREHGVDLIDLTDVIRAIPQDERRQLYFVSDGHWTPSGHRLAAREIRTHLESLPLNQ